MILLLMMTCSALMARGAAGAILLHSSIEICCLRWVRHTDNVSDIVANMQWLPRGFCFMQVVVAKGSTDKLTRTVEAMATTFPPALFLGQYTFVVDRVPGRHALINFAVGADGSGFQYAVKCALHLYAAALRRC